MARQKGQLNKKTKENAVKAIKSNLKHLSFAELESFIALAQRYKKEKLGEEELRLIKEKERIEQELTELKVFDKKVN
ncbi:MAG: hypothetical protein LBQ78_08930 [Tannerellaceae bacterium]|jgi:hypothetical protein|nr:hypothetical protein [Tannerellaceae bacterium]